jgi:hypothetical protein
LTAPQARAIAGYPDWQDLARDQLRHAFLVAKEGAKEIEWVAFGGQVYRRERASPVPLGYRRERGDRHARVPAAG